MTLQPLPGRVLVELREEYAHVAVTENKHDTKTSGICVSYNIPGPFSIEAADHWYKHVLNSVVFWDEYKQGKTIERDGKKYAFIRIEDVDGYEEAVDDKS